MYFACAKTPEQLDTVSVIVTRDTMEEAAIYYAMNHYRWVEEGDTLGVYIRDENNEEYFMIVEIESVLVGKVSYKNERIK